VLLFTQLRVLIIPTPVALRRNVCPACHKTTPKSPGGYSPPGPFTDKNARTLQKN
jgi:hypothetical protein